MSATVRTPREVLAYIREREVKAVDLRFMDFPGLWKHFTVPADNAEPTAWTMEMDPPTLLNRYGLRHDTLHPGMKVTLTGVRARSGAPMMRAVTIEIEDGTVYRVSSRV